MLFLQEHWLADSQLFELGSINKNFIMESVDLTAPMEAVLFCGAQIGQQGRKSLIAGVDACALFGYALIIGKCCL